MLLQESRGVARTTTAGDPTRRPEPFTLEQGYQVAEGLTLAERALLSRRFGPDTLPGGHRGSARGGANAAATDWGRIASSFDFTWISQKPAISSFVSA
jgi:RNA polymerase sigma-70 factor (ECF subfamily)